MINLEASTSEAVIQVEGLKKHFPVTRGVVLRHVVGVVKAVDGISFQIPQSQTYGLVGESGCGKTTTANMILLVQQPTGGSIRFCGQDLTGLTRRKLTGYRASVQAVFQDPWSSLNPRMRAGSIILEPLLFHRRLSRKEAGEQLGALLRDVGLHSFQADHYPHEFSGGQRQRIAIARALSTHPKLVVLDEPVSALDMSIRAQIINLLRDLQQRYGVTYLLIAHDLATVRHMSHQVGVMYLGKIVEEAPARELFSNPMHPYTRVLVTASLPFRPDVQREEMAVSGEVPSPLNPPSGCAFHPRCPFAVERCNREVPELREPKPGHKAACHLL